MTPFRSQSRPTTVETPPADTGTPLPPGAPPGAGDPDSPLFIPDVLRPFYRVDLAAELRLWEDGPGGKGLGTPYRYVAAVDIYRARINERAAAERDEAGPGAPGMHARKPWMNPVGRDFEFKMSDASEGSGFRAAVEQIAATLGDTDRDAFFQPIRLTAARVALARDRDRLTKMDARHQATVCDACDQSTSTTRPVFLDPAAGVIIRNTLNILYGETPQRLCQVCRESVQAETQRRAAAQLLPDGRSHAEAAAAWLDAHTAPTKETAR
jgi:hypothetical protein